MPTEPGERGNLGPALMLLRQRLNVRQVELARKLGLKPSRVGAYERGFSEPGFATLRQMLAGMGFDLHDLQDALDAAEGRPPRIVEETELRPPLDYLTGFLRLFAMMVADELATRVPAAGRPSPKSKRKG